MHSKFKVINKTLAFLLALVFAFALMPVVTTSASQAGIAISPPDYDLPVGGVLPFVPLPLSPEEAEDIPVLVKGKKKSLLGPQAYVAPSVPGGTNYGYEWLRTASDSTINDNRSILLGLYESFVEFSDKTYSSTGTFADMDDRSDLVTNGSVDATSLGLKVDVSGTSINTAGENSKKTIALLNLAWSSFIYDNPQYYLFDTFWLFKASGGPSIATLTAFIPTISAEYKTYSARQSLNALIESKYQEYAQLAGTVSTEYEKARIVHDKILAERDYSFVNNNPDTNAYAHNILGVMDTSTRGPVCEAYAEAYAYILHRLGIEASVLVGKASSGGSGGDGGHAWNIVKIGDAYYYADPTWDDCETIGLSGKYNDSGNEKNIMHYNYFLVGTGDDVNFGTTGTQVFTASHAVADHSGENGYYLYGLPAIADSKSSISPSTKTWINSFLQRGDIFDNYFIAFTNKRTDQLGSDSTALFTNDNGSNLYDWNAQNNRSFGAYTVDSHSTDIAVNAPMYKWVYNKTGTDITTIFPSSSPVDSKDTYDIVVEKPYKSGKNRAWTYGKGNYAGLDFGMVTLSFADATATVADATISGNTDTGLAAGQTATLTLANASVARTGLSNLDASDWFTGLPPGISVVANGAELSKTITLSFSGTPESASTSAFEITIPKSAQTSGNDLAVTANASAKFEIADKTAPVITGAAAPYPGDTSATLNFNSTEAGTGYYLIKSASEAAPDADAIKSSDTSFTVGLGQNSVEVAGLSASTAYKAYIIVEDAALNRSAVAAIEFTTAAEPDTTAPVISGFTLTDINHKGAKLEFTSDEDGTCYYLAILASEEAPDAGTIKSASNNFEAGASQNDIILTGLSASTAYKTYIVIEDKALNQSSIASIEFTTAVAPDVTAPVITGASATNLSHDGATLGFTSSEAGTYYYLVLPSADPEVPAAADVKAQGATTSGSASNGANSINLTGLSASTDYKAYIVVEDAATPPNLSDVASVTFSTVAAPVAPSITTASLPGGTVGAFYSQTLLATGDAPITWTITIGSLPAGLALTGDGIISGTPSTAGTGSFTVKATNATDNDTQELSIAISSAPVKPTITTSFLADGTVGTPYNQTLEATGTAPITWSIVAGDLPDGLSLTPATGVISGTPLTASSIMFTVLATNPAGENDRALSIAISPAPAKPSITTSSLPGGIVGTPYNQTLQATGDAPITWTIAGNLPDGLSLTPATGVINGTPSTAGTSNFTVKATNATGDDTQELSIAISPSPVKPTITTSSLPDGTVGASYSQTLDATGTAPIKWAITTGSLPAGLTLSEDGVISGTPTAAGTGSFAVKATNSADDDTKGLSISISAASVPPSITTSSLPGGTVGTSYSKTLEATGDAPITWTITTGSLPAGLTLSNAGVISGTPTAAGTGSFGVQASNSAGYDTKGLSISISAASVPPSITTSSLPGGTVGVSYSQTLEATGDAPIAWAVAGDLPDGLTLSSTTGVISGTPSTAGTSSFTVKATNATGYDTQTLSIAISAASVVPSITTSSLPNGTAGVHYSQSLQATGDSPITWTVSAGALPDGLSLASTGVISGTPAVAETSTFTVKAANSAGNDTKELSVAIIAAPVLPSITTSTIPGGTVGVSYSQSLSATGDSPITWTVSAGVLPDGLNLTTAGVIIGTPTVAGNKTFTVKASNSSGSDTQGLSISISEAPVSSVAPSITTSSLPDGKVGALYSQALAATGDAPITWTVSAGALPDGLSLASTGVISGTPSTTGISSFTLTAENSSGQDSLELSLAIKEASPEPVAPSITTSTLPDGAVGASYSQTLEALGDALIEWTVTSGALSAGLTLSSTGIISGTPSEAGTSTFTVAATNSAGVDKKELNLTISDGLVAPVAPSITTSSLPGGTVGYRYSQALSATGDSPITWTIDGTLPAGLSLSESGVISGIPTRAGTSAFTATASNFAGDDSKKLSVTISSASIGGGSDSGNSGGNNGGGNSNSQPSSNAPEVIAVPAANNSTTVAYTPIGETAKVELPTEKVAELIKKSEGGIADIDLSKSSGITAAELPASAVKEIAKSDLGLSVSLPAGELTLNTEALGELAKEAGSNDIAITVSAPKSLNSLQQAKIGDRPAFDVSISSGGKFITKFGNGLLTVSFPYELKTQEKPERVKVFFIGADGIKQDMKASYNAATKIASFTTSHLSTFYISYEEWVNTYPDVSGSEWFYEYVKCVSEIGLMSGTSKGFEPDSELSRAMLVTILFNLAKPSGGAGATSFSDVPSGQWYSDPIAWAANAGIVSGTGSGKFEPNRSTTREEMMAILFRFAKWQGKGPGINLNLRLEYPDAREISSWAIEAVMWTTMKGIVSGTPINGVNFINPKGTSTRAQAATIITRYMDATE